VSTNNLSVSLGGTVTTFNLTVNPGGIINIPDDSILPQKVSGLMTALSNLSGKANTAGQAFTGDISAPNIIVNTGGTLTTSNLIVRAGGTVSGITLPQSQVTNLTTDLANKANTASPTFNGNFRVIQNNASTKLFLREMLR
jgi:hypothetical protein